MAVVPQPQQCSTLAKHFGIHCMSKSSVCWPVLWNSDQSCQIQSVEVLPCESLDSKNLPLTPWSRCHRYQPRGHMSLLTVKSKVYSQMWHPWIIILQKHINGWSITFSSNEIWEFTLWALSHFLSEISYSWCGSKQCPTGGGTSVMVPCLWVSMFSKGV